MGACLFHWYYCKRECNGLARTFNFARWFRFHRQLDVQSILQVDFLREIEPRQFIIIEVFLSLIFVVAETCM